MRQGPNGRRGPRRPHSGSNNGNGGNGGNNRGGGEAPRRSAASLRNQSFDSNGPDVRVRGNAWQVHEKYLSLARDAQMAGDRVAAENYFQHAEHYYRIVEAINEATAAEQAARGFGPQPDMRAAGYQQPHVSADGAQVELRGMAPPPSVSGQEQPPGQQGGEAVVQPAANTFFAQEDAESDLEQTAPRAAAV